MPGSKRRLLTPEQEAWVAERYPNTTNAELVLYLIDEFGVTLTATQLAAWARRNGLRKTDEAIRRTRAARAENSRKYTDEMRDFMRGFVPGHVYPETAAEFERRFGWRISKTQYKNLCMSLDVRSGVRGYGCFPKGHVPANKGKTWAEFISPESQRRIREAGNLYQKGNVPHNRYHELLDVRQDGDGRMRIYVRPRNAKHSAGMWISYSRFVWMKHHGREFPDDCRCVHCNHDNQDFRPENLMAVPNEVYGIITWNSCGQGLDYWDRDSLRLAVLHAKLLVTRKSKERMRPRTCAVCGKRFVPGREKWAYADRMRTCDSCLRSGKRASSKRGRK